MNASEVAIQRRIREKRGAPRRTEAKNLLKAGRRTLRECHGEVNVEVPDNALELLQRIEPVTLKAWKCVSVGTHEFFDPDKYEVVGELLLQLKR